MSKTKFFACRECWSRGCNPYPEDSTTTFTGNVTGYVEGSFHVTIDEDGDAQEGEPSFESEVYDQGDNGSYSCDCCGHDTENLNETADRYGRGASLVALAYDEEADVTVGEWSSDYEDEDEEDDVSVPPFTTTPPVTPVVRDDGRYVSGTVASIVAAISNAAEDADDPHAPEVQITYGP
jgi:hypothetical protein